MRALICDDDATVRLIAKRLLEEQFGCAVVECKDGVEALAALSETPCNFAILDVDMPGMGGLETLEEIRASDVACDLPVIIMTAERDEDTVIKLMQLGVSDYIVKPLRHSSFVSKIDHLLRTLPKDQAGSDVALLRVGPDSPTIVADGDASFRALLAAEVKRAGEVIQVESGAAALMAFRRTPADVVFVGSNLGVMSPDRVAAKIREVKPWGVRLIRIVDQAGQQLGDQFDGVLVRSALPETLRESLRPYIALDKAS